MATLSDFTTLISIINIETDTIAAKLQGGGGLTADEENTLLAEITKISDRLKTLATPTPVPPPPAV